MTQSEGADRLRCNEHLSESTRLDAIAANQEAVARRLARVHGLCSSEYLAALKVARETRLCANRHRMLAKRIENRTAVLAHASANRSRRLCEAQILNELEPRDRKALNDARRKGAQARALINRLEANRSARGGLFPHERDQLLEAQMELLDHTYCVKSLLAAAAEQPSLATGLQIAKQNLIADQKSLSAEREERQRKAAEPRRESPRKRTRYPSQVESIRDKRAEAIATERAARESFECRAAVAIHVLRADVAKAVNDAWAAEGLIPSDAQESTRKRLADEAVQRMYRGEAPDYALAWARGTAKRLAMVAGGIWPVAWTS